MNLDLKDRKILYELDKNSRQSYSAIAKAARLNKETCIYRINGMIKNGVISSFATLIGLGNAGFFSHKIYFQLQGVSEERKREMIENLKKNRRTSWIAECVGEYDLIAAFLCRNIKEFEEEKRMTLQKYSDYVQSYSVGIMAETRVYRRGYLIGGEDEGEHLLVGNPNAVEIDPYDVKILGLLASNSRIPLLEIAKKSGLNAKTVVSRMRKMEKNKVIQSYKIFLNLDRIGYRFYKAFIHLGDMNLEDYKRFIMFCRLNGNIIHLVENVGSWELEPELEVESEDQYYDIINEMKKKFPNFIKKVETARVIKEHKAAYFLTDIIG